VFSGFAAFLDPPKASAAPALAALAAGGVAVKIVSGDNELVAATLRATESADHRRAERRRHPSAWTTPPCRRKWRG